MTLDTHSPEFHIALFAVCAVVVFLTVFLSIVTSAVLDWPAQRHAKRERAAERAMLETAYLDAVTRNDAIQARAIQVAALLRGHDVTGTLEP